MTVTVYAKHEPYWETGHMARVVEEMRQQGAPTIRVMRHDGDLFALEGTHRLHAAEYLGLEPRLVVEIADVPEYADRGPIDTYQFPEVVFTHALVLYLEQFLPELGLK